MSRELGIQQGAAIAFGLMGMAEAIRRRPTHTWRLKMTYVGMSSTGWHCSEGDAWRHAAFIEDTFAKKGLPKATEIRVEREEHAWCEECTEREEGHGNSVGGRDGG